MSSPKAKTLFVNISSFAILLSSWWVIGSTVSQEAVQNDGRYFEKNSFLLAGSYYNDWLPVITAIAFGLGWGIAVLVLTPNKSKRPGISFRMLFLLFASPVLCFLLNIGIENSSPVFANNFMDPSLLLLLYGVFYGALFSQLRTVEQDTHD